MVGIRQPLAVAKATLPELRVYFVKLFVSAMDTSVERSTSDYVDHNEKHVSSVLREANLMLLLFGGWLGRDHCVACSADLVMNCSTLSFVC